MSAAPAPQKISTLAQAMGLRRNTPYRLTVRSASGAMLSEVTGRVVDVRMDGCPTILLASREEVWWRDRDGETVEAVEVRS